MHVSFTFSLEDFEVKTILKSLKATYVVYLDQIPRKQIYVSGISLLLA